MSEININAQVEEPEVLVDRTEVTFNSLNFEQKRTRAGNADQQS